MAVPLPLPKTPALVFVAIYRMPIYEVVLAIGLGKLLKYTLYAYVASRFPRYFVRWFAVPVPNGASMAGEQRAGERAVSIASVRKLEVHRWWVRRTPQ